MVIDAAGNLARPFLPRHFDHSPKGTVIVATIDLCEDQITDASGYNTHGLTRPSKVLDTHGMTLARRLDLRRSRDTQGDFTAKKIYFPGYVVRGVFATFARLAAAFGRVCAI